METSIPKIHQGRNIKRLREMLGIKQEVIAKNLDITQQSVSELEQKEVIEESMLKKISQALQVPVEAIKNMSDETVTNYINTFYDNKGNGFFANNSIFNPMEKIIELYSEKEQLYERMIKEKEGVLDKLLELLNRKIE